MTPSITLPDDATVLEAAGQAAASHLHLVIDRDGQTKLTPVLLPGMQKIAVHAKQADCSNVKAQP